MRPLESESPATGGTVSGAGSIRSSRNREDSAGRAGAQSHADRIATYDTRTCIGSCAATEDGRFLVFGSDGTCLGACGSRREAQSALYRAFVGEARP